MRIFVYLILFFTLSFYSYGDNPKIFNLTDFSGALLFQYQRTIEEEYNFDDLFLDIDRNYLEGGLELNLGGSIYHPNLITFQVDLNLIANKSKSVYFSDESLNNSLNNTYNINLSFLKKKITNFQLYAQKNFASADRRFSERFFMSTNRYGFNLTSSNKILPIRLDIYRNISISESFSYQERDELTNNLDLKVGLSRITGSRSVLRVKARDYSERIFDANYKSLNILSDFLRFYGRKKKNSITAIFSMRKMTGDLEQEVLRFNMNHRYYLKDKLYFLNSYKYVRNNSIKRNGDQHSLHFTIKHQLFDSLDTKIKTSGKLENFSFQKISAFSYGLELIYRKKLKFGGINIVYLSGKEHGDYISKSEIASNNEFFSFSLADSIILATPGINPGSIRITDNDLTILYIEGIDYQLDIFESNIIIIRIPGGAIPSGGQVNISYDLLAFPDFHYNDLNKQFNLNLNVFKYFQLFLRSSSRDQDISSDFLVTPFQSYSKKIYGAKIASKIIDAEYSHEDYDSNISSYLSKNLRVSFGFYITNTLKLLGNASVNRLEFDSQNNFVNFDSYFASLNFKPNPYIYLRLIYRNLKYETQNYQRNRESVISKLEWNFRRITLEFFYEYILNEYDNSNKSRNYFALKLRRMF